MHGTKATQIRVRPFPWPFAATRHHAELFASTLPREQAHCSTAELAPDMQAHDNRDEQQAHDKDDGRSTASNEI